MKFVGIIRINDEGVRVKMFLALVALLLVTALLYVSRPIEGRTHNAPHIDGIPRDSFPTLEQ